MPAILNSFAHNPDKFHHFILLDSFKQSRPTFNLESLCVVQDCRHDTLTIGRLCGLIVWVRVVPRRTVVGDIDQCFDNLSGSHGELRIVSLRYLCLWSVEP